MTLFSPLLGFYQQVPGNTGLISPRPLPRATPVTPLPAPTNQETNSPQCFVIQRPQTPSTAPGSSHSRALCRLPRTQAPTAPDMSSSPKGYPWHQQAMVNPGIWGLLAPAVLGISHGTTFQKGSWGTRPQFTLETCQPRWLQAASLAPGLQKAAGNRIQAHVPQQPHAAQWPQGPPWLQVSSTVSGSKKAPMSQGS